MAQSLPPRRAGELARHPLTGPLEGFDVVLIDAIRPATIAREHRHPGVVLGYVLDGQLRFGVNHETPDVVSAGGTFFEPHGAVHTTNEAVSADSPARFLAFFVVPTGSPLVGG